jgi:cytidine deaminase
MKLLETDIRIMAAQPEELTAEEQLLIKEALQATYNSYAPYSNFHVGAAVRLANGIIVTGCNQENVAYPSGLCAERTALFSVGAQYPQEPITALAIAARGIDGQLTEEPASPCGACRQVILESETRSQRPMRILLYGRRHVLVCDGIRNLLPLAFSEF